MKAKSSAILPSTIEAVDTAALSERISRREAIRRVSLVLGGIMIAGCGRVDDVDMAARGAARKAAGLQSAQAIGQFSAEQVNLLNEVAETILPATNTPGAKAANVGPFMALMVTDCYTSEEQAVFIQGLAKLDDAANVSTGKGFMQLDAEQRLALLSAVDQQAYREACVADGQVCAGTELAGEPSAVAFVVPAVEGDAAFFRMMKDLTFLGYFTSEIGCTQAQRYKAVPGRYDPCVDYSEGSPSWV